MWQRFKNIYHLGQAIIANYYYGFPSKKLTVIGVTGTDGKTTTASLIYHILSESGRQASMITSIGAVINGRQYDIGFHVTTPNSFGVQKFLKQAVEQKSEISNLVRNDNRRFMVLETTSHALDQYRVWGIHYKVGVITNISKEHLDYHKTYEKYLHVKAKLISYSEAAVINSDDLSFEGLSKFIKREKYTGHVVTYGMENAANITPKSFPFTTQMLGEFNEYNALAAIAACKELGIDDDEIRNAVASFFAPLGREQIVYEKDFSVMIDFAHTSNSIEQLLRSLRKLVKGRIIHVFGSAGLRDSKKRPKMGTASSRYADIIILTSEDPRSEDVNTIIDEIASGIKFEIRSASWRTKSEINSNDQNSKFKEVEVLKISDRKTAIEAAILMAQKGDLVVCTGKAHERSMAMGNGEEPWNEFDTVYQALKKRDKSYIVPKQ